MSEIVYDNPEDSTFDVDKTNKEFDKTEDNILKKISAMKEDIKRQRETAYKKAVSQEGLPPSTLAGL